MPVPDAQLRPDVAADPKSSASVLGYRAAEKNSYRLFVQAMDWVAACMAIGFALAFIDACQLNLMEAPMNGGGSSYIASAPCNEQWQRSHPELASFILALPHELPDTVGLLMLLPYILSCYTLPYLVIGWLSYRIWRLRHSGLRWSMLLATPLVLMLAMAPWLHQCMMVIAD